MSKEEDPLAAYSIDTRNPLAVRIGCSVFILLPDVVAAVDT